MNNTEFISVLIVESQTLMLTALSAALSTEGIAVLGEVKDSRQAIRSVAQFNPQVLVFSIGTPSLPDLERIDAIRHESPNVLILALIDEDFRGQERMAQGYGAHRVLTKSASRAELISAIQDLVRKNISTRATLHRKERRTHRELDQNG